MTLLNTNPVEVPEPEPEAPKPGPQRFADAAWLYTVVLARVSGCAVVIAAAIAAVWGRVVDRSDVEVTIEDHDGRLHGFPFDYVLLAIDEEGVRGPVPLIQSTPAGGGTIDDERL